MGARVMKIGGKAGGIHFSDSSIGLLIKLKFIGILNLAKTRLSKHYQ